MLHAHEPLAIQREICTACTWTAVHLLAAVLVGFFLAWLCRRLTRSTEGHLLQTMNAGSRSTLPNCSRNHPSQAKAAAVVGSASAATQAAGTLPKDPLFCSICNVRTTSEWDMSTHLGGQKHQRALAAASPSDIWRAAAVTTAAARRPQVAGARKSPFCCQLCGIMCHAQTSLEQHLRSNRHALQQFGLLMRQGRMLTANTHNVHVSQLPDPLPPVAPGEAVAYTLTVTNLGAAAVSLRRVGLLQPLEGVTVHDSAGVAAASAGIGGGGAEVVLERGEAHSVTVLLAPTFMGLIRGVVLFDFGAFQVRVQRAAVPGGLQWRLHLNLGCACRGSPGACVHILRLEWRKVLHRQVTWSAAAAKWSWYVGDIPSSSGWTAVKVPCTACNLCVVCRSYAPSQGRVPRPRRRRRRRLQQLRRPPIPSASGGGWSPSTPTSCPVGVQGLWPHTLQPMQATSHTTHDTLPGCFRPSKRVTRGWGRLCADLPRRCDT